MGTVSTPTTMQQVQLASHSDFLSPFYMRIAKDTKDFLGGRNNNVLFSQFPETMEKLLLCTSGLGSVANISPIH